jgi:hypothetical protein
MAVMRVVPSASPKLGPPDWITFVIVRHDGVVVVVAAVVGLSDGDFWRKEEQCSRNQPGKNGREKACMFHSRFENLGQI